jgi:DNA-binding MarR family transcriptional regulator
MSYPKHEPWKGLLKDDVWVGDDKGSSETAPGQPDISRLNIASASIRSLAKRVKACKILLYLYHNDVHTITEIAEALNMSDTTVYFNVQKLEKLGLIEREIPLVGKNMKYIKITDKELAEVAIYRYKWLVGFKLARLVPYQKTYAEQLKSDKRFIEKCELYGLTLQEGIDAVQLCPKIGSEEHSDHLILWRKEQGYDSTEKKESEVEEVF